MPGQDLEELSCTKTAYLHLTAHATQESHSAPPAKVLILQHYTDVPCRSLGMLVDSAAVFSSDSYFWESWMKEELLKSCCRQLVVRSWKCLSAAAVSRCSPQGCEVTLLDTSFAVLEPCGAGAAHAYSKADNLNTFLQKNICFFAGPPFWRKKGEPFKAVIIKLKS